MFERVLAPAPNLTQFCGLVGIAMKKAQSALGRRRAAWVAALGLAFTTRVAILHTTMCISEVPGFVKQASTPPAVSVRIRLSASFISLF